MKRICTYLVLFFFGTSQILTAQVKLSETPSPGMDSGSLLELESNSKALVLPRLTSLEMNAFVPLEGAIIFNKDFHTLFQFTQGIWERISSNEPHEGDIKTGIQSGDHSGWYLLDGRVLSALPDSAQSAAQRLSLGANLPNAIDKFLFSGNNGTSSLLSSGGQSSFTLLQSHLPAINFMGITSSGGVHNHSASTSTTGNHNHSAFTSSSGSHTHSGTALSGGTHNHDFYTANHDVNGALSQGYPSGNNHIALRTTDRRQRTHDNSVIHNTGTAHTHNLSIGTAGSHSHSVSVNSNGNHSHSVTVNNSAAHDHSIVLPSGGSNTPIPTLPSYLTVNTFIYLGK